MRHPLLTLIALLLSVSFGASCDRGAERRAGTDVASCDDPGVRDVAERFGQAMKRVSLLAPDSVRRAEMEAAYGPLVAPRLIDAWIASPNGAPGRETSSPWPDRVEVRAVEATGTAAPREAEAECLVRGDIVFASSSPAEGMEPPRQPVTIAMRRNGSWQVVGFEEVGERVPAVGAGDVDGERVGAAAPETGPSAAVGVVRDYYAAIDAGEYGRAWGLWAGDGTASGQTLDAFTAGFTETAGVRVEVGTPGRVEGAAGSRFIEVPVTVHARTKAGVRQRFEGTYTLRRSVVDGATAAQRLWRIHDADIRSVP